MFSVSSHLANQAALCNPGKLPAGSTGLRLVAACPKQAINDGLSSSNLVIHQLGTTEVETVDGDNRAMLRVKIQQGLAEIIAGEKLETANLDAVFQQENTATKGLIVAGAGLTGLGNAAWGLLSWAKEASDLVNPVVRGWNHYQAAKSALNSDNFAASYADNALKAEKRELVEAMGFDPSAITMEQLDSAMEVADLIWSDSALQSKLTQFCKDYIAAQHLTEQAEMLGGAVFEILLTIILAAVTGGAAAVASLGSKARHMTKFRKVGDLLMEFAEASKKAKNTNKSKGVKANKGKSASFSDFKDAGEVEIKPLSRPPMNKPVKEAIPLGKDVPYDSREIRKQLEGKYGKENIVSTTVPPKSMPNVKLAGSHKEVILKDGTKTRVVFDKKGFPIFDDHAKYDTVLPNKEFREASYKGQMRMGSRELYGKINSGDIPESDFTPAQLKALKSGKDKIPGYTWHHHQDTGRMQLISTEIHNGARHVGWESMSKGQ